MLCKTIGSDSLGRQQSCAGDGKARARAPIPPLDGTLEEGWRASAGARLLKGATPSKADHSRGATPSMYNRATKKSTGTTAAAPAPFHR